jgi:hypothetical protein
MQLFPVELIGVPTAVPFHLGLPGPADRSRTHLFQGKRFGEDCPEKSARVPELLQKFIYAGVPIQNDVPHESSQDADQGRFLKSHWHAAGCRWRRRLSLPMASRLR